MRQILTAATVSASLFAVLAAAPAAQAGFDRVHKHAHKHPYKHHGKHLQRYEQRVTIGYPNDCRQMKRRAILTGNAYWRYAAHRCVTDRYISH